MGLQSVIESARDTAFEALSDLVKDLTLRTVPGDGYVKDGVYVQPTAVETSFRGIITGWSYWERQTMSDWNQGDMKVIASTNQNIEPEIGMQLVDSNGNIWEMKSVEKDPAEVIWILGVRRGD